VDVLEKEVSVEFSAQSKGVVEKVKIRYFGDSESFINLSNEQILEEAISLQKKAESHALMGVFRK